MQPQKDTEAHRKNCLNRHAAPSSVVTGLALASPALLLLPGGVKSDIIPGRENLSGSLSPPGRPADIYHAAALSARGRRAAFCVLPDTDH